MQTRWIKGLNEQQISDVKSQLKASTNLLNRLTLLIEEDIKSSTDEQESRRSYDSPNWAIYQADLFGEIRAYKKILRLINLKDIK